MCLASNANVHTFPDWLLNVTKVTVVIAAWNAAETLERAINSTLNQKDVSIEVIIVDDASTDNTMQVAKAFVAKDDRVKYIRQTQNGGPSAARNAGFDAASGTWGAVLDADDAMSSDRLVAMTSMAERNGADVVYDNLAIVDATAPDVTRRKYLDGAKFQQSGPWDMRFFVGHNQAEPKQPSLGYLKPVFRLDFVRDHAIRYREELRNGEDFHFLLDMLQCGAKLWYMPDDMYRYTTGGESISSKLNLDHARALIAATVDFRQSHKDTIAPDVMALMARREQRLRDLASAEKTLRDLKDRRIGAAFGEILKRPSSLFRLRKQLAEALAKRLS